MEIQAIVPMYTDKTRIALRTEPPLTAALVREFDRRSPKDYLGNIKARGGLLILAVTEIGRFPNDRKGDALPIILARELTDAQKRTPASSTPPDVDPGELDELLVGPAEVESPDRTRYLYQYGKDLGLPVEGFA